MRTAAEAVFSLRRQGIERWVTLEHQIEATVARDLIERMIVIQANGISHINGEIHVMYFDLIAFGVDLVIQAPAP